MNDYFYLIFHIYYPADVRVLHPLGLAPGYSLRSPRPSQLRPEDPRVGAEDTENTWVDTLHL